MLSEEKDESTAAMAAMDAVNANRSASRLSFRGKPAAQRRQITPSDGTLRGYIRQVRTQSPHRNSFSGAAFLMGWLWVQALLRRLR